MDPKYKPENMEPKWQAKWEKDRVFEVEADYSKPKYYLLEMFPYPSGKLHMGHVRNYTIGDVVTRFKVMQGFNVLHPMGWDAFGLPAENAAIENKVHPNTWTRQNIANMKRQLKMMGYSYDWRREFATCDPTYYKWEQKIFIEMFEKGLVEKKKSWVNWCDKCDTVLANEQVEDGFCWRHGDTRVKQKELSQWFFKITKYADELLEGTEKLPGWPEKVLLMQRNWIGKSHGAMIHFNLERPYPDPETKDELNRIVVYTTRPDTIFGATFMSLAAENPLCEILAKGTEQEKAVTEFCDRIRSEDKIKRSSDDYVKEGVFTGAYCLNPMTGARMPIYVANFVLMDYGTGAVMAVPTHDQRDFEFATVYKLPLIPVVQPPDEPPLKAEEMKAAYEGRGTMINSGEYNGMDNEEFKKVISARFEKEMRGGPTTHFRLRDWLISRQRFWGAPIPIVYCDQCGTVPVAEKDLPVELPAEVEFDVTGGSPLPKLDWWVNTKCPKCGGPARRETDTMDTFVESSWYYERYASPHCGTAPFDKEEVGYWLPVDQYIGGIEHAVLHLLYSRFYTKVLRDLGYVKYGEPFTNLLTQGMVLKESQSCPEHGYLFPEEARDNKCSKCGRDVMLGRREKMSKSKKNVVDPEEMIKRYGADTLRLYLLFEAPPDKEIEWSEDRIQGVHRFLNRVWAFAQKNMDDFKKAADKGLTGANFSEAPADMKDLYAAINRSVKDSTERIGQWMFNTALASLMELMNDLSSFQIGEGPDRQKRVELLAFGFERLVMLLTPFCPHVAEELWNELGYEIGTFKLPWPGYDPQALIKETVEIVVQINGKVRAKASVPAKASKEELESVALSDEHIKEMLEGKSPKKVIVVPGKLVNIVI